MDEKNEMIMKNYLRNWSLMRAIRLALGIVITIQGIQAEQWLLAGFGGLFSLMPLLNIGRCGGSCCDTPTRKTNQKTENITYEEIR